MTMAFLTDTTTSKRIIDDASASSVAVATAATEQLMATQKNNKHDYVADDDDDLNLEKTLRAAATTTIKYLLGRNESSSNDNTTSNITTTNNYDNDNDADDVVVTNLQNMTEGTTTTTSPSSATALNNVSDFSTAITMIRSNVNRVLYMYFQNKTISDNETINDTDVDDDFLDNNVVSSGYNHHGSYVPSLYKALPNQSSSSSSSTLQQHYDPLTKLTQYSTNEMPLAIATTSTMAATTAAAATQTATRVAATMTSEILQNSTWFSNNINNTNSSNLTNNNSSNISSNSNVILTTMTHLNEMANSTMATATSTANSLAATGAATTARSITYPSYRLAISSYENCSALFSNYTQPIEQGLFCNWTWDKFLCWPPTPAGVVAHMNCPSGFHGVDAKKFANRKCELDGHWGSKPNETFNPIGWTDYNPCFKPEVRTLMDKVSNLELVVEIAKRTRTLEIVGLILSLVALIISLIIFCNFRSLRNNRTKIHKNLFIAMVLQVVIRLTLYLDQAYRRDSQETTSNNSLSGIENRPYLCEASYVLLEYAKTAMFMWMFIEGWYLHNMVTVTVFQGRFPYKLFSIVGWGVPVLMTAIWATCTALYYAASTHDCWWNYNLTPYYWILEGPRIIVITINFAFLLNIIRVLVMKLRESQASDIEQTRKAVRAAIVLLPLLGTINVLYLIPAYETPWKFALWSYGTHFLTTFQGFFIALLYCFLNGEVRAVLLKSLAVYMSVRGHPEWVPKRASMYSQAYNTAPDTENHPPDNKRNESPSTKRLNGRKASCSTVIHQTSTKNNPKIQITHSNATAPTNHYHNHRFGSIHSNNNNGGGIGGGGAGDSITNLHNIGRPRPRRHNWLLTLCFRGQKNKCVMSNTEMPPKIFMTTKMETLT